jgi:hypothetical protein
MHVIFSVGSISIMVIFSKGSITLMVIFYSKEDWPYEDE